ncbi:MAG: hypothetical protein CMK59_10185, partial [Proteobacteria bacterium]|nr:hypothetical protein [Pseudomonadota bacterium]
NHRLQHWWAGSLLRGLQRLFQFKILIDGDVPDCGGSYLFVRHVSSADALLPMLTLIIPQNLRCHYVLKQELCWDPCLDIVAHRIPNAIVNRAQRHASVANILRLTAVLSERSCVVLYPEGTRFTPGKRERYIERIAKKTPFEQSFAERLKCTLPPRKGGTLSMLVNRPSTPVVFVGHVGFDRVGNITNLVNGGLFRQEIHCAFWKKYPPVDAKKHEHWLEQNWLEMDRWLLSKQEYLSSKQI